MAPQSRILFTSRALVSRGRAVPWRASCNWQQITEAHWIAKLHGLESSVTEAVLLAHAVAHTGEYVHDGVLGAHNGDSCNFRFLGVEMARAGCSWPANSSICS